MLGVLHACTHAFIYTLYIIINIDKEARNQMMHAVALNLQEVSSKQLRRLKGVQFSPP